MDRHRAKRDRTKFLSPRLFFAVLLGCLTAVVAFSQAAASVGLSIETFRPLGAGFFSMRTVQVEAARQAVDRSRPANPARLSELGRQGLVYAPLNTRALWLVGQSWDARGQSGKARDAMQLAERVSRRDAAVQLWLALDNLRNDQVAAGLRHFDLMIRTNEDAAKLVTPALARVLVNPDGRQQMGPYFTAKNPWVVDLMGASLTTVPKAAPLAQVLLAQRGKAPDVQGARAIYALLVEKLLREKAYDLVLQLYPKLPGAGLASLQSLQPATGGKGDEGYPPFVWDLADNGSQGGDVVTVGDRQIGIEAYGAPGTIGPAASKLVAPGKRTTLQWSVVERSANEESSAKWVATCLIGASAGSKSESGDFLDQRYPLNRPIAMPIPANCQLMQVDLTIAGGIGRNPASVVVAGTTLTGGAAGR